MILADEINRAPAKVQAALPEAMEELAGKPFVWGDEFRPKGKWMANTHQGHFLDHDQGDDGHVGITAVAQYVRISIAPATSLVRAAKVSRTPERIIWDSAV